MVGKKWLVAFGLLLVCGAVSAQLVPYFPVSMFPENPKDGDVVEVYVSNYDDLAGSARFVWMKDGVVYRNVTEPFTATSISDSFTVFPGSWNVTVYVYDRSDPPKLINLSSISFEVSGTTTTPTPAPELTPTPTPTVQPETTTGSQTPAPASGGAASGGSAGGAVPAYTPETAPTPSEEMANATVTPLTPHTENETAVNGSQPNSRNITQTPHAVETPEQAPETSGTEMVNKTHESEKVPQAIKTGETAEKAVRTPAFTLLAALLSVLIALMFRAVR